MGKISAFGKSDRMILIVLITLPGLMGRLQLQKRGLLSMTRDNRDALWTHRLRGRAFLRFAVGAVLRLGWFACCSVFMTPAADMLKVIQEMSLK